MTKWKFWEIQNWRIISHNEKIDIGMYEIGIDEDGCNILIIIDTMIFNDLIENYKLKDLDLYELGQKNIVIYQNDEIIKCTKNAKCNSCYLYHKCNWCVTKKLTTRR